MQLKKYVLSAAIALNGMALISEAEGKPLKQKFNQRWDPTINQGWQIQEKESSHHKVRHQRRRYEGGGQYYAGVTEPIPHNTGVGPRPGQWCGWWMRTQKGGGPELNLAWNWRNYGVPTAPQVGAVVVWKHHVGILVGQTASGMWLVKSGNDGGAVRTRPRSVEGALFRI